MPVCIRHPVNGNDAVQPFKFVRTADPIRNRGSNLMRYVR